MTVAVDAPWNAVARRYRFTLLFAAVVGVIAIAVTLVLGRPLAGACVCAGLILGGYNARRTWTETNRVAEAGVAGRGPMAFSSLRRLGFVTFVALVVAVLYRPLGWTVFLGLLVFQLVLVASLAGPLRRVIQP